MDLRYHQSSDISHEWDVCGWQCLGGVWVGISKLAGDAWLALQKGSAWASNDLQGWPGWRLREEAGQW